jgi:hypothetical protein
MIAGRKATEFFAKFTLTMKKQMGHAGVPQVELLAAAKKLEWGR